MGRRSKSVGALIAPSASGGPGTFRGTDYQIDCAAHKALDQISQQLGQPLRSSSIAIEPRVLHEDSVTRWDIRTDPPAVLTEAKATLARDGLEEFLQRVGEASSFGGQLELVFGSCTTPLLNSVKRLCQVASECGADASKFDELVMREEIPNAQAILSTLGACGRERLPRLVFEQLPEPHLKRELEFRSRVLYPPDPARLLDALSRRLREAAKARHQLDICDLVDSIEQSGMILARPTHVDLDELAPTAISAIAMLQAVPTGLPEEVVADATGTAPPRLKEMLSGINWISMNEGVWRIRSLPFAVSIQNRIELLCQALESLLHFLSRNETDSRADSQLINAVALARVCLPLKPQLSLPLFQATEHVVKNLGDKHSLLEISSLCIDASRYGQGINAELCARARAQAMLCGTSWVFQRTGRLQEARVWAEKSLKLGQDIGWDRNTAFSNKCIGRLERLEAEQPQTNTEDRARLLQQSAAKLQEAIRTFAALADFGPLSRQVGDCYSLMARTYLTAQMRGETEAALQKAFTILTNSSPKEYSDLLILNGDYEVVWGSREQAELHYTEVIDSLSRTSREHSEIYARALSKRARNRARLGRKRWALSDFERAATTWRQLGEHGEAAKTDWEKIEVEGAFEPGVLRLFAVESSMLSRLSAFNLYREQLGKSTALAHRSRPTEGHVSQYLRDARKRVALDYPEW